MKSSALALAFLTTSAFAQNKSPPRPAEFAMQIPVQVSGQNGVAQLTLPLSVYEHARNPNLADVRIFDAAGRAMPFDIIAQSASQTAEWRESTVAIFPVHAESTADRGDLELDVRAAQDGAVLSVHAKQNGKRAGVGLQALVLDFGVAREGEALDSLQLYLPPDVSAYRAELVIEQSADLKMWSRVSQSRVDWLQGAAGGDNQLVNDRIELSRHVGRYARLQWVDGKPLLFARIAARWRSVRTSDDTLQMTLTGKPGRFPGDWVYAASPALRASEVGLELPVTNTVISADIGYYRQQPPPKREWLFAPVTRSTFYRLLQNGSERTSSRIHIHPLALSEWVVRPQTPSAAPPTLVLSLKPQKMIFTAQGGATDFTLAFGADEGKLKQWTTSQAPLTQVAPGFSAAELANLERATLGEAQATQLVSAEQASESGVQLAFNRRTLVLWGVLIVGVVLLAGMSWRLYKQMQTPGN